MKTIVTIISTTIGVEFEINNPRILSEIVEKADEVLRAPKLNRSGGKIHVVAGDRYFLYLPKINKVIFHKDYTDKVKRWIVNAALAANVQFEFNEVVPEGYEPYTTDFDNYGFEMVVPDHVERFVYQNELVEFALRDDIQTVVEVQTGRGKASPLSEPLLTPTGWRLMGDIKVGDEVIGRNGYPTTVTGVFPQPNDLDIYEVTTYDGRKCRVCGEHLWMSFYCNTTKKQRWRVRDTLEIKRLISLPNPRVYIPLPEPVHFNPIQDPLPIDPYVLGVSIGDGYITNQGHCHIGINSEHLGIVENIISKDPIYADIRPQSKNKAGTCITYQLPTIKPIKDGFINLGLAGKRSWEKFIPKRYMLASVHQRWELLRGLMDTDGTVNKDGGQPSYCTASKQLAKDVQELAWSLGGIATISTRKPYYTHKGERKEGRLAYNVFMRFPKPSMLFNLEEKRKLVRDDGQYTDILKVRIKSIEPVPSEPMQCISVAAKDSLYVAKDYMVTHNTKSSQKVMVKDPVRTCIIVKPSYMDKWYFDTVKDKTGLRVKSKHVRRANGIDAVVELLNLGRSGKLDKERNKVLILPTTTLNLFLKDYCANPTWYDFELRDFFKHLGVGRVIYDEIHEHFLTVYLTGIALNPPKLLEMSATLQPGANKDFVRQRYLERFPLNKRYTVPYIACVDGRGLYYHIDDPKVLGVINRMKMYNHNAFEKRLMMNRLMDSYFDMIYDIFKKTMYPKYEKGQKALFLFSLIETCTAFRDYLKRRTKLDGYDFKIVKYNGGDSFDEFLNADIAVSTPGKAGTAVDVYGLANMYITTAIDDRQLNEQMAGRPRPLIEWNMSPKAWFFHCMEVKKHCQYLNSRMNSLQPIMLSFKIADVGVTLRRSNGVTARITNATSAISRPESPRLPRTNFAGIPRGRKRR